MNHDREKKLIASYLVSMEKEQRLSGLLVEEFFTRHFKNVLAGKFEYKSYSCGWLSGRKKKYSKDRRWYRVTCGDEGLNESDRALIGALPPGSHEFYIVKPLVHVDLGKGKVLVSYTVKQWGMRKDGSRTPFEYSVEFQTNAKAIERELNERARMGGGGISLRDALNK